MPNCSVLVRSRSCARWPNRCASHIEMINSTAIGAGVAGNSQPPGAAGGRIGTQHQMDVMTGGEDFFEVDQVVSQPLHGAPYRASPRDFLRFFLAYNDRTAQLFRSTPNSRDPRPATGGFD